MPAKFTFVSLLGYSYCVHRGCLSSNVSVVVFPLCVGMYCFFCHPCFMCTLATQMDECVCGPFCLGYTFETSMRTKLRAQFGIQVSLCVLYVLAETQFTHGITLKASCR